MHTLRRYSNKTLNFIQKARLYKSDVFNQKPSMAKKLILYGDEASPPVRFVMMTASALGMGLDFYKVDLFLGENNTEFYKKLNPLRKVPVLVADNSIIRDSHTIALFLCRQSQKEDLYPKDALERVKVDEMLFFNSSALFPVDSEIFSNFFAGKWPVEEQKVEQWNLLLDYLECRLCSNNWLAGDKVSLGDLCCAATVSSLQLLIPATDRHAKLNQWMNKLQTLPYFEINANGLGRLKSFIDKMNLIVK